MSSYNSDRIDSISAIPDEKITHENLRYMYGTGIAIKDDSSRQEKKYRYRHGIQTAMGDIEKSVWIALVNKLIDMENGRELYNQLFEWEKDTCTLHSFTNEDIMISALRGYVSLICDNKGWWDYIRFNMKYRPYKLDDPELMTVITECCKKPCKVAKEQITHWHGGPDTIPCPYCNKGSEFTVIG